MRPEPTAERAGEPLVTVAIPCHNEADALARTLAALAAQEAGTDDLEVILVDNLSSDPRVGEIASRYSELLDLTLVRQRDLEHPYALCRARNLALARARGRWFWTLDSDCMANPGFLATLRELDPLEVGEHPAFTGERIFIDAAGLAEPAVLAGRVDMDAAPRIRSDSNYGIARDRRFPALSDLPDVEHPWDLMHGGNTVFETALGRDVGGYDEDFDGCWGYEDDEFAYRLIAEGGARPRWSAGLSVYHQESASAPAYDRLEKSANPNWQRVCDLIPGYREYKLAAFAARGVPVRAGARA